MAGILASQRLTNFRLEQLEDKVNRHNNLVTRMAVAERDIEMLKREKGESKNEKDEKYD